MIPRHEHPNPQSVRAEWLNLNGEWEFEKLEFTSWLDYGIVALTDCDGKTLTIHAPDVKAVVAGFIDDEVLDLQDDFTLNEEKDDD